MRAYQNIVFMQGDDANEPIDILYNWIDDGDGLHTHYLGPTAESVDAALEYLAQWDYGEPTDEHAEPSSGTSGDVWERDGYLMSASLGYGYIGLERIVEKEE